MTPVARERDNARLALWPGEARSRTLNDRLRQLLEQLSEQLCEILAEAPEVHETVEEIRGEGYSLYLLLDCKPKKGSTDKPGRGGAKSAKRLPASVTFKINTEDLAFLRSVGIDPTRRCKTRRDPFRASLDVKGPAREGD